MASKRKRAEFCLQALVRPNIWALQAYHCARDDYTEGILLDANENSFGPPVAPNDLVYERYPCPYQQPLKEAVAAHRGIAWTNIFVGVGSDEAIDMLMRIFGVPGADSIIICPPTYGMYSVSAATNDLAVQSVPLTPTMDVALEEVNAAVTPQTKIIFICSPGNPACKLIDKATIVSLLNSYDGIVVVDEAYIDFAPPGSSCCDLVASGDYPNLVVLQTMSKAFGLAGIRCGFAMGSPELIAVMNKVKAPYNVNKLTSSIALEAFQHLDIVQAKIDKLNAEKEKLRAALESLVFVHRVLPSDANFLMFSIDNASAVYKAMADAGVVVRDRASQMHCDGCLRVTIGTAAENAAFLASLTTHASRWFPRMLKSRIQQYAWGLPQDTSLVHSLGACNCCSFNQFLLPKKGAAPAPEVGDESKPFAELWMGTHPNGPALIVDSDGAVVPLSDYLKANPELAGVSVTKAGGTAKTGGVVGGLPFLLKVLSVNTALSIQAHPNRDLAAQLYKERPDVYKDPNHKPELICALEEFVGMCGFRAAPEICSALKATPELRALVTEGVATAYEAACGADPKGALAVLFGAVMRTEPEAVAVQLSALEARLSAAGVTAACTASSADAMALYLQAQYPGDVGVWCVYFLNVVELTPGQALSLEANIPHAYIKGQGVEIMACSDNVVRAGLTPKLRDVETLCAMLDYTGGDACVLDGEVIDAATRSYSGTADDFKLLRCELAAGGSAKLPLSTGPQVILGVSGCAATNGGVQVEAGGVFFVPAGQTLTITAAEGALVFVALCNDGFFF